jgi:hypothetical protein
VLGYVTSKGRRKQFAQAVQRSGAVWVSNELPGVFPEILATAPPAPRRGMFLLSINGQAVAWTSPHGESITWFGA